MNIKFILIHLLESHAFSLLTLDRVFKKNVFIGHINSTFRLQKPNENNIESFQVAVHKNKLFFYIKGTYLGFAYDSNNLKLKLTPVPLGKIQLFTQYEDGQKDKKQKMRILKWDDLIKKPTKVTETEQKKIEATFDKRRSDRTPLDTKSDKYVEIPRNISKDMHNLRDEIRVGGLKDMRNDKLQDYDTRTNSTDNYNTRTNKLEDYNTRNSNPNNYITRTSNPNNYNTRNNTTDNYNTRNNITENHNTRTDKLKDYLKLDYFKRDNMRKGLLKNNGLNDAWTGDMSKLYDDDTKICDNNSDQFNIKIEDCKQLILEFYNLMKVLEKRPVDKTEITNNEIESDSEMTNRNELDVSIEVLDPINKKFIIRSPNNLCVTFFHKAFLLTECKRNIWQIFRLVKEKDVLGEIPGISKAREPDEEEDITLSTEENNKEGRPKETGSHRKRQQRREQAIGDSPSAKKLKLIDSPAKKIKLTDFQITKKIKASDSQTSDSNELPKKNRKRTKRWTKEEKRSKSIKKESSSEESQEDLNGQSRQEDLNGQSHQELNGQLRQELTDEPSQKESEESTPKITFVPPHPYEYPNTKGNQSKMKFNFTPGKRLFKSKKAPLKVPLPQNFESHCRTVFSQNGGRMDLLPPGCEGFVSLNTNSRPFKGNTLVTTAITPQKEKVLETKKTSAKVALEAKDESVEEKSTSMNLLDRIERVLG